MNYPAYLNDIERDVRAEVERSTAKHGDQSHLPDGTDEPILAETAAFAIARTDRRSAEGSLTWRDILREEVFEAFAETDPDRLDAELNQVMAVAYKWRQAIADRGGEHA